MNAGRVVEKVRKVCGVARRRMANRVAIFVGLGAVCSVLVMENGSIDEAENTVLVHKKCVSVIRRDVMEAACMRLEKQWRENSLIQKSFAIRSLLLLNRTQNVLWFLLVTGDVGVSTSMPFDSGGLLECTTILKDLEPLIVKRFTYFMLQLWTWKLLINLVVKVFQRGRIC